MSDFKDKMHELGGSMKSKMKILGPDHLKMFARQVKTTMNPNHRHDEEHEHEIDRQRQAIRDGHRFNSFAPETSNSIVRSHVDGHDFFWAVSIMLEEAKTSIMILDWWLSPELFLRRPPAKYPEYRLDRLLLRKAEEGVKIYIIVYKEVTQTMSMSSSHTKHYLEGLHENIKVQRHPDHMGGEVTLFWSHHEKMTVVDSTRATVGGLDLCFGRWDLHDHPLADVHPTAFNKTLFPGQDFNISSARVLDFQNVDHFVSNAVDESRVSRMPWHDTSMTIIGPAVVDLTQHFVERWNFVKHAKYKHDHDYDWLGLPAPYNSPVDAFESRQSTVEQEQAETRREERRREHPHLQSWMDRGRSYAHPYHFHPSTEPRAEEEIPKGNMRVQVVRSSGDWSHGILVENSIQRAYIQMIMEANHFIYIENQFFITNTEDGNGPVENMIGKALVARILSAARSGKKFRVIILIPEIPAFPGDLSAEGGLRAIMGAQYKSINRGGFSIMEQIAKEGFNPADYIRWYNLRSYDRINAPASMLKEMEQRSGVSYHEAQVALAREWVGVDSVGDEKADTVNIRIPMDEKSELNQMESTEGGKKIQSVKMPESTQAAKELIERFEAGSTRPDEEVSDNVGQHALNAKTGLHEERWLGTEQEERDCYVTELAYIHSKLMIVDDRRAICGSSNLNDRSMCGDHDSEVAMVVEDLDMVETTMDGKPYQAARFAKQWRHQLMKEHLGIIVPQGTHPEGEPHPTPEMMPSPHEHTNFLDSAEDQSISDPLSDEFFNHWTGTAKKNREIFSEVFRTVPDDSVTSWAKYKDYVKEHLDGVPTGHVANNQMPVAVVKEKLAGVQGHLVEMPLQFLIDEKTLTELSAAVNQVTLPLYL